MLSDQAVLQLLHSRVKKFPDTLVVLGSGWNKVLDSVKIETEISYQDLFGVKSSVPGHQGKLVIATVGKKLVAFMAGRFHLYEGYNAQTATTPIRVFAAAGMKKLILTAAVGALNEKYHVGDFFITSDVITLFLLDNPLVGPQFIDMSECLSEKLRSQAKAALMQHQLPFHEGVYVYCHGPHFESPADKMVLRFMGGDVCGMSTVPEVIQGRALGLDILSLCLVTNLAFVKHNHKEVLAEADKASKQMTKFLQTLLTSGVE